MDESDKEKFAGWLILVFDIAPFVITILKAVVSPHCQTLSEVCCLRCVCEQVRRWSSSALGKVFSTTPSRATTPASLPTDKLVNYRKRAQCFLVDMKDLFFVFWPQLHKEKFKIMN